MSMSTGPFMCVQRRLNDTCGVDMETFVADMEQKSTTIHSDTTHRMTTRPAPIQAGKGRFYEAMPSDFCSQQSKSLKKQPSQDVPE